MHDFDLILGSGDFRSQKLIFLDHFSDHFSETHSMAVQCFEPILGSTLILGP